MNISKFSVLVLLLLLFLNTFTYNAFAIEEEPLDLEIPEKEGEFSQSLNSGTLLLKYLFSVLGVILITYIGVKFFAQKFKIQTLSGDWIRVLDRFSLDSNKNIYLVEIEGKGYVLGVTDSQINVLTVIEDEIRLEELRGLALEPVQKTNWRDKLPVFNSKNQRNFHQSLQYNLQEIQNLYSDKEEDEKYEK